MKQMNNFVQTSDISDIFNSIVKRIDDLWSSIDKIENQDWFREVKKEIYACYSELKSFTNIKWAGKYREEFNVTVKKLKSFYETLNLKKLEFQYKNTINQKIDNLFENKSYIDRLKSFLKELYSIENIGERNIDSSKKIALYKDIEKLLKSRTESDRFLFDLWIKWRKSLFEVSLLALPEFRLVTDSIIEEKLKKLNELEQVSSPDVQTSLMSFWIRVNNLIWTKLSGLVWTISKSFRWLFSDKEENYKTV